MQSSNWAQSSWQSPGDDKGVRPTSAETPFMYAFKVVLRHTIESWYLPALSWGACIWEQKCQRYLEPEPGAGGIESLNQNMESEGCCFWQMPASHERFRESTEPIDDVFKRYHDMWPFALTRMSLETSPSMLSTQFSRTTLRFHIQPFSMALHRWPDITAIKLQLSFSGGICVLHLLFCLHVDHFLIFCWFGWNVRTAFFFPLPFLFLQ